MPQCHGPKQKYVQPYGRGSLHSDLTDLTFKVYQRVTKVNEGEASRMKLFSNFIKRHQDVEQERQERTIQRYQKSLEKFKAYQKVLDDFKVSKLITLRKDFNPAEIKSAKTSKRCQQESRLYFAGFSMHALQGAITEMTERRKPHNRRGEQIKDLLTVAKRRSNFVIDRKLTNQAIKQDKFTALLEESRRVSKTEHNRKKRPVIGDVVLKATLKQTLNRNRSGHDEII